MATPPVFIKIEEFQELVDIATLTKERLKKARQLLARIKDLKSQEDAAVSDWGAKLDAVETRLSDIDKRLFSRKNV